MKPLLVFALLAALAVLALVLAPGAREAPESAPPPSAGAEPTPAPASPTLPDPTRAPEPPLARSPAVPVEQAEPSKPRGLREPVEPRVTPMATAAAGDRVVGRVLDADGAPLAGRELRLYLGGPDGGSMLDAWSIRLDGEGRFAIELSDDDDAAAGMRVHVAAFDPPSGPFERRADGAEDVLLLSGETNVGDLRLRPVVVRITGRCVDRAGTPLAGVYVTSRPAPPVLGRIAHTGPDGAFDLLGGSERVELLAELEGFVLPEPVVVALGADGGPEVRGVELVFAPAGAIVATLAPGGAPDGETLSLTVVAQESPGSDWTRGPAFDAEGFARASNLRAGAYQARIHRGMQLLLEVPDVHVSLGADTVDPRLQDLDLRARLRTVALLVVDEAGWPVRAPVATVLQGGRAVATSSAPKDALGRVQIDVALSRKPTLVVTAPGFRPSGVDPIPPLEPGEELRVVLRAGIAVRLRSATRPQTEKNGGTAILSLRRVAPELDESDAFGLDESGAFDLDLSLELATVGEALAIFPGPGTYRLGLSKTWRDDEGRAWRTLPGYDERTPEIEVREADAGGLLVFDLPDVIIAY